MRAIRDVTVITRIVDIPETGMFIFGLSRPVSLSPPPEP